MLYFSTRKTQESQELEPWAQTIDDKTLLQKLGEYVC